MINPNSELLSDEWGTFQDAPIDFTSSIFDTCYLRVFDFEQNAPKADVQWLNENYPVGVAINPYATKEEIIDYINKNIPVIRQILDSKKSSVSPLEKFKRRNKEIADRDDFIFRRHQEGLSRKDIMELCNDSLNQEELKIYDYDTIGKIIQREKARRGYK